MDNEIRTLIKEAEELIFRRPSGIVKGKHYLLPLLPEREGLKSEGLKRKLMSMVVRGKREIIE